MRAAGALLSGALCLCLILPGAAACADGQERIDAKLTNKTDRYGHNVLGGNEYGMLTVQITPADGGEQRLIYFHLSQNRVFEDLAARVVDMNGDATPEIVVVESSREAGAQLAVYGFVEDELEKIAWTPPIGRRDRWLAPVGIADLNGDGRNDVAYVETPHIGGTLRVWTMGEGPGLIQIAEAPGFSNHRIGEDFITGGVRDCGNGPELVLPNFNWSRLMVVRYDAGALAAREIGDRTDAEAVEGVLACRN